MLAVAQQATAVGIHSQYAAVKRAGGIHALDFFGRYPEQQMEEKPLNAAERVTTAADIGGEFRQ